MNGNARIILKELPFTQIVTQPLDYKTLYKLMALANLANENLIFWTTTFYKMSILFSSNNSGIPKRETIREASF